MNLTPDTILDSSAGSKDDSHNVTSQKKYLSSSSSGTHTSTGKTDPEILTEPYRRQNYYHEQQQDNMHAQVLQMFEKCFSYQNRLEQTNWNLPPANQLFTEYYQFESLQELKVKLNQVKSKLNNYDIETWSSHTRRQDPAGEVPWCLKSDTCAEFVTVAWCKMYECLGRFPELVKGPNINSLHICEAPGAFIAALNHYLYSTYERDEVQWNWLATTLNPYYEGNPFNKMIVDDRFLLSTLDNWLFHKDFTGNIIDEANIENMKEQCECRLGNINLITADGSIDCINSPECQEEKVALLHYAEIISALHILADGGSFVIKMFTMYEASSVCKLYLLNCVFEKISVFKPCTSKRGNSEVYVVCLNYKKGTKYLNEIIGEMKTKLKQQDSMWPLFAKSVLPVDFLRQHEVCCRFFMNYQINAIEKNIDSYKVKPHRAATTRLQSLRKSIRDEYYRRYKIQKIPNELKVLKGKNIENSYKLQLYKGSHSERVTLKEMTKEEQIFYHRKRLNELEKIFKEHEVTNEIQFQFESGKEEDNVRLSLYSGMRFCTLNSSLFVNVHLLIMRNELNDLYKFESTDCLWLSQPRLEYNQGSLKTTINFNDFNSKSANISLQQEHFFKSVISALFEFKPDEIIFINMPFLTHYAVSVLRYLSCYIYKKLNFALGEKFEIILSTCSENFIFSLEELKSALFSNLEQDILCFLKIPFLHRNDFKKTLCAYNNMLLLQNYKHILHN